MKSIYSNKYIDWLFIFIILAIISIQIYSLTGATTQIAIQFIAVYLCVSLIALIALLVKNKMAHRLTQLFIIVVFISSPALIIYRYLSLYLFYGTNQIYLLQQPLLFISLVLGIVLFMVTIKKVRALENR